LRLRSVEVDAKTEEVGHKTGRVKHELGNQYAEGVGKLEQLAKQMSAPRVVIRDKDGRITGTKVAE
jgi:hypothetical protein